MTFLLSEDLGLRQKIQGITVFDQRADGDGTPRQVGVWFGQPDQEERKQTYPYITIDMIDINRDVEREHRGVVSDVTPNASYLAPEGLGDNQGWEQHLPIPVSIDYQITTYSRQPRHDRQIIGQLIGNKLPIRFGSLVLEDGTIRRLDVLNVSKRDVTEQAKRLFVNAITVRVSSEISEQTYRQLYKVLEVRMDTLEQQFAGGTPGNPHFIGIHSFSISQ
jgi:hypothetical protein